MALHVTVFSTRGKMTEFEIVTSDDGKPELRYRCGSSQLVVPMDEHQLAAMAQDINRHLDRQLTRRLRVVKSGTAPVAAGPLA